MRRDINQVVLCGRLVRDAEVTTLPSGQPMCNFSIALSDDYTRATGETVERSYFFDVTIYGNRAVVGKYLTKGKQIIISGKLVQDRWERDGTKYSKVKIVCNDLQFLSSPRDSAANISTTGSTSQPAQNQPASPQMEGSGITPEFDSEIDDDDVPF